MKEISSVPHEYQKTPFSFSLAAHLLSRQNRRLEIEIREGTLCGLPADEPPTDALTRCLFSLDLLSVHVKSNIIEYRWFM